MDPTLEVIAYLAVAFAVWEMLRNRDRLDRLREPWVKPIKDLGQK